MIKYDIKVQPFLTTETRCGTFCWLLFFRGLSSLEKELLPRNKIFSFISDSYYQHYRWINCTRRMWQQLRFREVPLGLCPFSVVVLAFIVNMRTIASSRLLQTESAACNFYTLSFQKIHLEIMHLRGRYYLTQLLPKFSRTGHFLSFIQ